jgi:uncharacterized protein YbjT (DUF2867 family)
MTVVVVGATGNIGRHVVAGLAAKGEEVRALTRDAARAREVFGAAATSVDIVQGDLADADGLERLVAGADRAFLATTGTPEQPALELGFLRAAAAQGVEHVVKISVLGPALDHVVPFARWHAEIERDLPGGLATTILRPSWFAENFFGSAPTIATGAIYGSAGDGRVGFVDSRDTAAVVVAALTGALPVGDYAVTGPDALTFAEAAAAIGQGLGREVSYVDLTDEQFHAALLSAGLPADIADAVVAINQNARRGALSEVSDVVRRATGAAPRSLEQWAADNRAAFADAT